jgi:hypothetical protein
LKATKDQGHSPDVALLIDKESEHDFAQNYPVALLP